MEISKKKLIKEFTKAIEEGRAGIFAGAGLSIDSGYVNWKELMRPFAEELHLNIDKEKDYLAVAQYYRNQSGTRASINRSILEAFTKECKENENIDIITRLPIKTFWTTNYDRLIEKSLEKNHKKADVKINSNQLTTPVPNRDAIVYKMHGDVEHPAEAVLTKDDYVLYDKERPMFRTVLETDLLSKTFLFIGFSFEDPNIDYILNQIHALMGENISEHYCFFKKVQRKECVDDAEFEYKSLQQRFRVEDLERFGIRTVYIDDYSEINEVLKEIEFCVKRKNVFISGSSDDYGTWDEDKAKELIGGLSERLIKEDFKVISGFGRGVGSYIINGALTEIWHSKYRHTSDYLNLYPFQIEVKDDAERKKAFIRYRNDMISDSRVAIFVFGNKKNDVGNIVEADGCIEEFRIAKENKDIIIPIGSTGFAANSILNEVKTNIGKYPYLKSYLGILETETDITKIIDTVIAIAKKNTKI